MTMYTPIEAHGPATLSIMRPDGTIIYEGPLPKVEFEYVWRGLPEPFAFYPRSLSFDFALTFFNPRALKRGRIMAKKMGVYRRRVWGWQ